MSGRSGSPNLSSYVYAESVLTATRLAVYTSLLCFTAMVATQA